MIDSRLRGNDNSFGVQRAFTLIELMVAAGIVALIGLAIASALVGGLNIFRRMEGYTAERADALIAMEKIERDLRNTFYYTGISFTGSPRKVTFPGLIRTFDADGKPEESIGSITYFRDESQKTNALSKEERRYHQAANEDDETRGAVTRLALVEDVKFKYYFYDADAESYGWVDEWAKSEEDDEDKEKGRKDKTALEDRKEEIPLGINVEISYKSGGRVISMARTIFIETAVSFNLAKVKAARRDLK